MARLRRNGLRALLSSSAGSGDLTLSLAAALTYNGGVALPSVSSPDFLPVSLLDTNGVLKEIVYITAYTSGATSVTVSRGKEGTTATSHTINAQLVAAPTSGDLDAISTLSPDAETAAVYCYGNSYGVLAQTWHTLGRHWLQLFAAFFNLTLTTYALSAARVHGILSALVNQTNVTNMGTPNPVAGSLWPGTSSRRGLVVVDGPFSDYAHYPSMQANPVLPALITTSDTKYVDGQVGMWRAVFALLSTETRVEQTSGTFGNTGGGGGTWTQNSAQTYTSGTGVAFTSTANDIWTSPAITPPQKGPLAGKVFLLTYKLDTSAGAMATMAYRVDSGAETTYTPTPWEQYAGSGGLNIQVAWDCIMLDMPVDGASHTARVRHTGGGGFLYVDCILVPSEDPNDILVMDNIPPNTHGSYWNATQVGYWKANYDLLNPLLREVAAEFPNVIWVDSTMTTNGLSLNDGIHPRDRGMEQRKNDAVAAVLLYLRARVLNQALSAKSDSFFGVN